MIELIYLDSPRINRKVNVAAHLRALRCITTSAGISAGSHVVFNADGVRRVLQTCRATVLYLLGHSEGSGAMLVGGVPALDGRALAVSLLRRSGCLPRTILFNTCDAARAALVSAAVDAGVPAVVVANGTIPIDRMCAYAETLLQAWLGTGASLTEATQLANETFGPYGIGWTSWSGTGLNPTHPLDAYCDIPQISGSMAGWTSTPTMARSTAIDTPTATWRPASEL